MACLDWRVWRGMLLEVVGDNHSPALIYVWQWGIMVLDSTWCLLAARYMCWPYVCIVVLDRYLVLLVLPALGICVDYRYVKLGAWCAPGVALVKFKALPISHGVMGHICALHDMYAWTCDEVHKCTLKFHT